MTPYIFAGLKPRVKLKFKLTNNRRKDVTHSENTQAEIKFYSSHIIKQASDFFQISEFDLKSKSRKGEIVEARHIAMYAIKFQCQGSTLKGIGKMFNRDHSTVVNSINTVTNLSNTDTVYKKKLNDFLNNM